MKPSAAPSREEVLQHALALNPADRAYVADELERSLPQTTFASEEIAAAWSEEIDRRIAAYESGKSKALDIDAAMDHARQALLEHRSRPVANVKLRILPEADGDMISAAFWYDEQRLGLGEEFLVELQAGFDYVNAHAAKLPRVEGYAGQHEIRRHLLKRFPYAIVVAQIANELIVIAIAHTRRRPFFWLDRLN